MDVTQTAAYILLYAGSVSLAGVVCTLAGYKLGELHGRARTLKTAHNKQSVIDEYRQQAKKDKARIAELQRTVDEYARVKAIASSTLPSVAKQAGSVFAAWRHGNAGSGATHA